MRLHEHEAADLFEKAGIVVPKRGVAESTEEALRIGEDIGYPLLVKAQVLVGGRGLAGGIRSVESSDEMAEAADALLGSEIKGLAVRKVLVSEKLDVSRELYLGITMDGFDGRPVIVVSTEGGVNIEETAREHPEKIASVHVDPGATFYPYQARDLLRKVGISRKLLVACADVVVKLYRVFTRYEALIAEINPLVVTAQGGVAAVDAVLEIDNSAASRHAASSEAVKSDPPRPSVVGWPSVVAPLKPVTIGSFFSSRSGRITFLAFFRVGSTSGVALPCTASVTTTSRELTASDSIPSERR